MNWSLYVHIQTTPTDRGKRKKDDLTPGLPTSTPYMEYSYSLSNSLNARGRTVTNHCSPSVFEGKPEERLLEVSPKTMNTGLNGEVTMY